MAHRVRSLLLLWVYLLASFVSRGQTTSSGYSITNYNSDNALPQNSINGMAFDRNGFLWMATEMGLVRFDGLHFREYNSGNTPLLTSNRIAGISVEPSTGRIITEPLFNTRRIFTITDDYQLKVDSALSADPHQANFRNDTRFSFDNLYNRWAARDTGVFGGLFDGLEYNADLLTVGDHQAYVRKINRYYFLDDRTADVRLLSGITGHALKVQFIVGDLYVFVDMQNRLYAFRNGEPKPMTGSPRLLELLKRVGVTGPYPVQASLRWARDTCHSFFVYKGNILLLNARHGVVDFDTLAANTSIGSVNCMIYDERNKIIYAGTAISGLYILKKQEFQRLGFTSDNYAINSLYAQVELPDGRLLTGSGVLDTHKPVNIPAPGLYDRMALFKSSDDSIWYSSYGYVRKMDAGLKHSTAIQYIGLGGWMTSIVEAPNKDILFCAAKLFRWRAGKVTVLLDHLSPPSETFVIRLMNPHELWLGTVSGLFSYDLDRGTVKRLPGLRKATVRTIYTARDGSTWIGTYGQGFYKYVQSHFVRMPVDPGNNLATINSIMEDKQGFFWLSTNKGLYRVSENELNQYAAGAMDNVFYYYFDKSSGFGSNEFNGACVPIMTGSGYFSLPSLDGLIQFKPESITVNTPDRSIFIDRVSPTNKTVLPAGYFNQAQDAGPLIFSISSPYFGNPANLRLDYSIPELDTNWHPLPSDGKLILTGLHNGRYRLTVRKQEPFAKYVYATVEWTILPYWYETIWAYLLAAALLASVFFFIFRLRYIRQVKRAEQLEQKVAERTVALSLSNEVKEKMIAIILHDFRSPLRFLHMLAVRISENYKKASEAELREMLLMFRNATRELFEFAQDFLVWSNAQREGFIVKQEPIVLRKIVEEIVQLYETGADIRNNAVHNLVPDSVTLVSDAHILKLIIRNLTDNANKYTLNGEIKIEAFESAGRLHITITDSGRSMSRDQIDQILNTPYQAGSNTQGFGYKIVLELLDRIQGELAIDAPGVTGNRVTLLF
ncbi:ligand-binding sensor domain-containing protein [Dinghuibacter silviterrae]|uniref:Signal transduction histidine kinase n=1 Tax=Dinghuibacter silviterrae TaxID=1539049 RepID=A0A4R8DYW0_9BACT|nr:HAMP domain-containing sensor histidine kinase [Dinghuibacter silviterrae]TDX02401.1 signal transduction histidine kinase [Dinghuibacter silviterrae]